MGVAGAATNAPLGVWHAVRDAPAYHDGEVARLAQRFGNVSLPDVREGPPSPLDPLRFEKSYHGRTPTLSAG